MYFRKMFMTECQKFRFSLLLAVFFGLALVLTSCSDSKQKHLNRGEDLLKQRKFQESVMEFRAAADIDKSSAEAHWGLVRAQEGLGDINETISELHKVLDLNPSPAAL